MDSNFDIPQFSSDHDALIAMYVELRQLRKYIEDGNDIEKVKIADHEARLRRLEYIGALLIGSLYVIQIYINFLKK